jgi:tol-pal system protein YbgF
MFKMPSIKLLLVPAFFGVLLLNACIAEQDFYALDQRVAIMERNQSEQKSQLDILSQKLDEIGKLESEKSQSLRNRLAESSVSYDQLSEELRSLRGQVEETQYLLKQQQRVLQGAEGSQPVNRLAEVEKMSKKTHSRVVRLEQYLNLVEASKQPAVKPPAPRVATPQKTASVSSLYNVAKQSFDKGDYQTARESFETFLKKYPKSANADNAQFWIGETYYREKWYDYAILEYQKVIDNYPKGNKVPASLLKQGLSFYNLGDKANSRLILQELVSKYPKSNEATVAKQKLKDIK